MMLRRAESRRSLTSWWDGRKGYCIRDKRVAAQNGDRSRIDHKTVTAAFLPPQRTGKLEESKVRSRTSMPRLHWFTQRLGRFERSKRRLHLSRCHTRHSLGITLIPIRHLSADRTNKERVQGKQQASINDNNGDGRHASSYFFRTFLILTLSPWTIIPYVTTYLVLMHN
jgi:hypothetical protein